MADDTPHEAQPLEAVRLTAEELVQAVIAGQAVRLADGTDFAIAAQRPRQALAFFSRGKPGHSLFTRPLAKGDEGTAESFITWLDTPFEPPLVVIRESTDAAQIWHAKRIEVVQFGGLHPLCLKDGTLPAPLVIDVEPNVLLIHGQNGAGKSSIAKALTFAFVEKVPVNAGEPEHFSRLVNVYELPDGSKVELPTIVPMPTPAQWAACQKRAGSAIETRVTVTFKAEGRQPIIIRREIVESKKGHLEGSRLSVNGVATTKSLHEVLGVSQLSLELAVVHMARLPSIRLGSPETLGAGVQALTGLSPVRTLAETTAQRLSLYLSDRFTRNVGSKQSDLEVQFHRWAHSLAQHFNDAPSAPPQAAPLSERNVNACEISLLAIKTDLARRESSVRAAVASAAGVPEASIALIGLSQQLINAKAKLLGRITFSEPLAATIDRLAALDSTMLSAARDAIQSLTDRANAFAQQHAKREVFIRRRLYALIGGWLKDQGIEGEPEQCPTCLRPLTEGEHDHDVDMPVAMAIAQAQGDSDDLRHTVDSFVQSYVSSFKGSLDAGLSSEINKLKLLHIDALVDDWAKSVATDMAARIGAIPALSALVGTARNAIVASASMLAAPIRTAAPPLDPIFAKTELDSNVTLMTTILDVAIWAQQTADVRAGIVLREYGVGSEGVLEPEHSLIAGINNLLQLLSNYQPVEQAKTTLEQLEQTVASWRMLQTKKAKAAVAAEALKALGSLGQVVEIQVDGMIRGLGRRTDELLEKFNRRLPYGPQLSDIRHTDGALSFLAEQEGVKGDATHITNASRQRAQLFAFVLALTEHVWQRDGGVRSLLLDDPQTLFDDDNKYLLARGLVNITHPDTGFLPFVLTIDRVFADQIARAGDRREDAQLSRAVSRWELHGRFGDGSSAGLHIHQSQLDVARNAWKDAKTDTYRIGTFCRISRVFLEQTLRDLLREGDQPIADLPTLQPLKERLAAFVKDLRLAQSGPPFKSLLAMLPGESADHEVLRDALNWSHHFQTDELTATHAEAIDTMLDGFLPCRGECFDVLTNWQATTTSSEPPPEPANENVLPAIPAPAIHIPVIGQLAASDGESEPGDIEPTFEQQLSLDPTRHTTFAVGAASNWLPPLISADTVLITGPLEGDVQPKDLVLVWDKRAGRAFVGWGKLELERRRVILSGFPGRSGLHKQFSFADIELRQVIACMFGAAPGARLPCEPRDLTGVLERRWVRALEITAGDSAEPLLYAGDMALVGKAIRLEELDRNPAPAFAFRLSDGTQVLKRLNREPQASRDSLLRQLLPIGDRGSGRIVAVGRHAPAGLPTIEAAYPLVGFWRG